MYLLKDSKISYTMKLTTDGQVHSIPIVVDFNDAGDTALEYAFREIKTRRLQDAVRIYKSDKDDRVKSKKAFLATMLEEVKSAGFYTFMVKANPVLGRAHKARKSLAEETLDASDYERKQVLKLGLIAQLNAGTMNQADFDKFSKAFGLGEVTVPEKKAEAAEVKQAETKQA